MKFIVVRRNINWAKVLLKSAGKSNAAERVGAAIRSLTGAKPVLSHLDVGRQSNIVATARELDDEVRLFHTRRSHFG